MGAVLLLEALGSINSWTLDPVGAPLEGNVQADLGPETVQFVGNLSVRLFGRR